MVQGFLHLPVWDLKIVSMETSELLSWEPQGLVSSVVSGLPEFLEL